MFNHLIIMEYLHIAIFLSRSSICIRAVTRTVNYFYVYTFGSRCSLPPSAIPHPNSVYPTSNPRLQHHHLPTFPPSSHTPTIPTHTNSKSSPTLIPPPNQAQAKKRKSRKRKKKKDMPICIHCTHPIPTLYTTYAAADDRALGKGVRLTQCPRCKRFADKYVEHDFVVLFIDLVLIKPEVYRHLLVNRLGERGDEKGRKGGFDVSFFFLFCLIVSVDTCCKHRRIGT